MQKPVHQIYSFDKFTLDLTRGSLLRDSEEIKLRPKSFEVLKFLIENAGRLISKDEIIEAVWMDTAVTDDSLVQCLKDIRFALNDKSQEIIKTVPRRGYIFEKEISDGGNVIYTEETAGFRLVIEEMSEPSAAMGGFLRQKKGGRNFSALFLASASFIIIAAAFAAWRFYPFQKTASENPPPMAGALFQNIEIKNITHVGNIGNNAISPDGRYVVFTTVEAKGEGLWLRQIATDSTQQILAPANVRFFGVSFSRDGNYVYFLRAASAKPNSRTLYRIPTLGGVTEKILDDLDWCPSFSHDGSQMVFVRGTENVNECILMVADADGRNERRVAVLPFNQGYTHPAWSPDGQTIAVTGGSTEGGGAFREVFAVNVSDGTRRTLTKNKWFWAGTVAWLADGSGLLMNAAAEKGRKSQLWMLSAESGEARQITNDSHNYAHLSLTADSRVLLAGHVELLTHLWIAPEGDLARARRITSGLGDFKEVRWRPDGNLLVAAFGSKNTDIFLRDADGTEIKQLTVNAGSNLEHAVSSDNRYIVFGSDRTGEHHVWRMDADGANPVQLTNGTGEKFAEISPNGRWVVYTAFQDWTLWKISIEGGEPVKLADAYARQATISPDGKWIVYMTSDNNNFVMMPFDGGSPVKTFVLPKDAPPMQTVRWSPDSRAIQFIIRRDSTDNIWQMSFEGGETRQVTNFSSDRIFSYDWSPDGKTLALIRGAWTADMVLISQK